MSFAINRNLTIFPEVLLGPVRMAALDLLRDVKALCLQTQEPGGCLVLQIDPELPAEQFRLSLRTAPPPWADRIRLPENCCLKPAMRWGWFTGSMRSAAASWV